MKKVLILALALFLNTSLCFASVCEGPNKRCTEYYPGTTTVKAKYKLKEGKIEGAYKEFHKNKNVKILAKYKNGLLEGEYLTYYDNSQLQVREFYKEGHRHGISYLYNPKGKLLNTTPYHYGEKQGYSYEYLEDVKIEKYYDNDELSFQKEYTYDDVLLKEKRYKDNGGTKIITYHYADLSEQIQGIITSKSEREKLTEIFRKTKYLTTETLTSIKKEKTVETLRFYNNDDKVFYSYRIEKINNKFISAKEREFDDFGYLKIERIFTNNMKNMKFVKLHQNGNIASKGQFIENPKTKKLDLKEGDFYKYNFQGKMTSKTVYKNGKEIDSFIWNYHPNGNYSLAGRIKNGEPNGIQTLFYDNGKTELKSNFANGKLHGKSISYSYEGDMIAIENYSNGILNGQKTTFYRNGNTKTVSMFKNGKLEGPFVAYHENGNTEAKGAYLNDKGEGYWVKYYKNGTPEADCNYKNGKKQGTCRKYWENGNYAYIDVFENGTLKHRRAFNAYGKELWSQKY